MPAERRKQLLLVALAIVLIAVVAFEARRLPSAAATGTAATGAAPAGRQARPAGSVTAPDVHLNELTKERAKPTDASRNLFRFKPKAPPAPPPSVSRPATPAPATSEPPKPAGPPPPPPITMKFIGIVEAPERSQRIAVLSDGRHVYYGREGEAVIGQYRILRIGTESIDMAYLDGRGRQTIRLSGS